MKIVTLQKSHPTTGKTIIVARGMETQKTVAYDQSRSIDANHGLAAGALIIAVSKKMHPLTQQNADYLPAFAVRSIDGGHSTHKSNESGTVHRFDV